MSTEKRYRYFIYSQSQHTMRTAVDKKINKVFTPGKVLVAGKWVQYTSMVVDPKHVSFADSKIVAEGYLEDMQGKYQDPTSVWGAQ